MCKIYHHFNFFLHNSHNLKHGKNQVKYWNIFKIKDKKITNIFVAIRLLTFRFT